MNTIEMYENLPTDELKRHLLEHENIDKDLDRILQKTIGKIGPHVNNFFIKNGDKLDEMRNDNEIDLHLIRMELSKRLWEDTL